METDSTTENSPAAPLSEQHFQELAFATQRALPVRRAARVAAFNGWITAIIAALSLPFAVTGLIALLVAIGLGVVAFLEFRGRRQLLAFKPEGATLLGWNQAGFMTLIIAYCCWMLFSGATDLDAHPEYAQLLGAQGRELYRSLVVAFYSAVIVLTVIFQGGNSLYYFSRRKHVATYLEQTPKWVQDLQQANSGAMST
ncbi:hypothetical protein [Stieleria varia]|uniref:Uncharacterized protein n=1 Tax=Stieleria varia TaxID=2528005 RepID=A0A5C6AYP1_9BACT|nr:hypothetical protein [Stieleria varia]TWU04242.1 hypothetical protein Pla52n_22810 [Stieleria varia]